MELTFFGVNVLLLLMVWRFMLRKTILDNTRDKLFDLRDEVRRTFITNGWDLSSPTYKKLRDLLNGHLRFTEDFSIWKIVFFETSVKQAPELQAELHSHVSQVFAAEDAEQSAFIKSVRHRAVVAVMDFAVFGSGFLLFISLVIAPFLAVAKVIAVLGSGFGSAQNLIYRSVGNLGRTTSRVMSYASEFISKHLFEEELFESYSFKIGAT